MVPLLNQVVEFPAEHLLRSDMRRSCVLNSVFEFETGLPGETVQGGQAALDRAAIEGRPLRDSAYPPSDSRPGPLISGAGRSAQVPDGTGTFNLEGDGDVLLLGLRYIATGSVARGSSFNGGVG